jgi:spore coat protein U-like protein
MRRIIAAGMLCAVAGPALAQSCQFDMQSVSFGSVDVTANDVRDSFGRFTASCSGTPGASVSICPSFNEGSGGATSDGALRYLVQEGERMAFAIWSDRQSGRPWGSYHWGLPGRPPSLAVKLDASGRGTLSRSVRFRLLSGQTTLRPGSYVSSFAGAGTRINFAYAEAGSCAAISEQNLNPSQAPFTVSANVSASCLVTASDARFGAKLKLDAEVDTANQIIVRCSAGIPYQIGLDGGQAGASDPASREMRNGAHRVLYGIFADAARKKGWGNSLGENTVSGTGTGGVQGYTGYLRIHPQATPPAGTYSDRIVVTVTY